MSARGTFSWISCPAWMIAAAGGGCEADGLGPTERIGGGLRSGTPLRGYPSHCASLAGPSRSRSHGRLRRPQSSRRSAPRCETAKAGKVSFQRRHLAQGKLLDGRQSQVRGQGPLHIIRPCPKLMNISFLYNIKGGQQRLTSFMQSYYQ